MCTGTETRLVDCPALPIGTHNCGHTEDAGVTCQPNTCPQGDIRLILQDGSTTSGRVEICNNNIWGTVCDDAWGNVDARVACLQLGLASSGKMIKDTVTDTGDGGGGGGEREGGQGEREGGWGHRNYMEPHAAGN